MRLEDLKKQNLLLLSGGVDSGLLAELPEVAECLFVDYGHVAAESEYRAAVDICEQLGLRLNVIKTIIPTGPTGSANVVHCRNTILCSLASALAKELGLTRVMIGINASDHADYVDCRPEWLSMMNKILDLQGMPIIEAPLMYLHKKRILQLSERCRVSLSKKVSCHVGSDCGVCYACRMRVENADKRDIHQPPG